MFGCCCHAISSSTKHSILASPYCPVHCPVQWFVGNFILLQNFGQNYGLGMLSPGCFRSFHTVCSTFFSCAALFFDMLGSCLYSVVTLLNMKWQRQADLSCKMYGDSEKKSLSRHFMAQFWTPRWRQTTTVPPSDVTIRSGQALHADNRAIGLS